MSTGARLKRFKKIQKKAISNAKRKLYKAKAVVDLRNEQLQQMRDRFINIVESRSLVPLWLQIVSLYIPPKWYSRFFEQVMVKTIMTFKIKWLPRIIYAVMLQPLFVLKRQLRYFGVSVKLDQYEKGKWRQTIKHWGRVIDTSEWFVK